MGEEEAAKVRSVLESLGLLIFFQAHRGGLDEVPENTIEGLLYAWQLPGAIPEVDVRALKSGQMICLHDETLACTTNAPVEIKDMPVDRLDLPATRFRQKDLPRSEKGRSREPQAPDRLLWLAEAPPLRPSGLGGVRQAAEVFPGDKNHDLVQRQSCGY